MVTYTVVFFFSVLYKQESLDSEPTVFLDPNTMAVDGTTALLECEFSPNGTHCAFITTEKGENWGKIQFLECDKREILIDNLVNIQLSCLTWTHDGKGLFYNRYPRDENIDGEEKPATRSVVFQQLCYHVIGTKQSDDVIVVQFDQAAWRS